jgi:C1A family cysteine protease
VLAVGYNLTANPPYWIIRNSWGTSWGLEGYMHLEFGTDACAVAEMTTSAII